MIDLNISQTPPRSFPGSHYIRLRPRLDHLTITSRGPGGSLTSIIVDYCGYELTHPLTSSHFLLVHPCPLSLHRAPANTLLSLHPSCPPSPPRLSTPPAPFHPLITLKCQLWPASLTPKGPPNYGLMWDISSLMHKEVMINYSSNMYTKLRFTRSVSDEEINKYVDGKSSNHTHVDARHVVQPLPPRVST